MTAPAPTLRLGRRTRKAVLVAHIASSGAWIGLDVVMAVLVFTAIASGDEQRAALSYQALELFAIWPMFIAGAACLVTGLLLGIGTKFGLVRYWWVATKLVLNLVLSTLVLVALRPGVHESADLARRLAAGEIASIPVGDIVFPPIVSPLALMVAVTLSVYKPWGRIRKNRSAGQQL
jgi:hypothetical protein